MSMGTGAVGILGSLRILVDADTAKAQAAIKSFGGRVQMAGATIGAGVGLLTVGAMKMGYEYANAMDDIRVATGATGDELASLEADFKGLASRTPYDIRAIATVMGGLNTRLGLAGEPLQDMTEQILQLGRITRTDATVAVGAITRMFGDWSVATTDQTAALDKLYRASQMSGMGYQELAEQAVEYGAPLRNLGLTFEQAIAMLGKWEKEGVNTTLALGGMKQALGRMAQAGVDVEEGIWNLFDSIEHADSAVKAMSIGVQWFGKRAGPDMVAAIREGRFAFDDMTEAVKNGSETIAQASKDTEGLQEVWRTFKNMLATTIGPGIMQELGDIGAEMGNMVFLLPVLGGALGKGIAKVLGGLASMGIVQTAARGAGTAIGAIIGPAMAALTGAADMIATSLTTLWRGMLARPAVAAAISAAGMAAGGAYAAAVAAGWAAAPVALWNASGAPELLNNAAGLAGGPFDRNVFANIGKEGGEALTEGVGEGLSSEPLQDYWKRLEGIAGGPITVPPPDIAGPIRKAFQVASAEVARGFGSVKDALANPPQMISKRDRLENMQKRMKAVVRNLKKAVDVGDPWSIAYWERARAKQAGMIERLRGTNVAKLGDIRRAYRESGVSVKGTWADVKTKTEQSSEQAADAAISDAKRIKTEIDAVDLTSSGRQMMVELANGIYQGIPVVGAAAHAAAAAAAGPLESNSPPKEGPLSTIDRWGKGLIDAWLGGIDAQRPHVAAVGARLAGALAPAPTMGRFAAVGVAPGSGGVTHIHVGTLIANDSGVDELRRRMERRMRLKRRDRRNADSGDG